METRAHGLMSKSWIHWVLEGTFIVVSVLLAFGVSEYGERRREREVAAQALTNILAEMEYNANVLEPFIPFHQKWRDAVRNADFSKSSESGFNLFFGMRPDRTEELGLGFPALRRGAWETAQTVGALQLIDYEVVTALNETYVTQDTVFEMMYRVVTPSVEHFDSARRDPAIQYLATALSETQGFEELLLGLYKKHLPAIREAKEASE